MSLQKIRNILNTRLSTLTPAYPVAWENTSFVPTPGQTHIRVNFLPSESVAAANHRNAMNFESGFYQVDVYVPQNQGTQSADTIAESIRAHFKRGSRFEDSTGVSLLIRQPPSVAPANREMAFWRIRVTVPWFAYTAP